MDQELRDSDSMRKQDNWDSQREPAEEIRDQYIQPQDERKAAQKRTFTTWMNVFLQRRDPPLQVRDLFVDLQDGRILMALLEELSGCKLLYRFRSSSHRIFRLNNISKALAFLDDRHVKLLGIDACGIADGTPSVVLNLIWNVILHFQVKEVMGGLQRHLSSSLSSLSGSSYPSFDDLSPRADDTGSYSCNTLPSKGRRAAREPKYHGKAIKTLLQWVQRRTSKCGIDVLDFGRSWRSGLAFLALVKSMNPDLVDLRESLSKEPSENLQQAFMIAHHSLDIPPLLEPDDVTSTSPDEKAIITYVSMFLGLHSCTDEDHTTNADVPKIPNFGSLESVSFGETLADDPEAQAFLRSLEKSSEQLLWKKWSRRSTGGPRATSLRTNRADASDVSSGKTDQSVTERPSGSETVTAKTTGRSPSVLQPPSPLDAAVASPEIQSWMETGSDWGKRRSEESRFSLSSEEGFYNLSALDSDEEEAYSYILDLNKEVFQPYNQKRQVARVEEETAEEMIEESKHLNAVNGGRESSPGQNGESEVHRKFDFDMEESGLRGELDLEPEAQSGSKEDREQERADRGQSRGDGSRSEEVGEKKTENGRLAKDGSDETENNAAKAKSPEVACWQTSGEERGEGGLSERRGQVSEWRAVQERGHLARSANARNLGNTGEGSGVKGKERENGLKVRSESFRVAVNGGAPIERAAGEAGATGVAAEGGKSRDCAYGSNGRGGGKLRFGPVGTDGGDRSERIAPLSVLEATPSAAVSASDADEAADGQDEDATWTPVCSATSQSFSGEGGLASQSAAASRDITPLELELLFALWILLYCCFVLPQMTP